MEIKQCTKCKEEKELILFKRSKTIKSGFASVCKKCQAQYQISIYKPEVSKDYYNKNLEKIKIEGKEYYHKNKNNPSFKEKRKEYCVNNESKKEYDKNWVKNNKDKVKLYSKKYYNNNKEKINKKSKIYNSKPENKIKKNQYLKKKYNNDLYYKWAKSIRSLIGGSFKRSIKNKYEKTQKTTEILGCGLKELKDYISNQFLPEMNFDNFGIIWEIDHITPVSSAKTEEEIIKLNHYSNLQPLFKTTEIAKSFGYMNEIGNRNKSNKTTDQTINELKKLGL